MGWGVGWDRRGVRSFSLFVLPDDEEPLIVEEGDDRHDEDDRPCVPEQLVVFGVGAESVVQPAAGVQEVHAVRRKERHGREPEERRVDDVALQPLKIAKKHVDRHEEAIEDHQFTGEAQEARHARPAAAGHCWEPVRHPARHRSRGSERGLLSGLIPHCGNLAPARVYVDGSRVKGREIPDV
eukprot:CAMPEP_0179908378 /NCGR_PEP_ID=MMETSP0982-20121206/44492_1 /TAXON_ID=483367 /ORGANISM="non described non described, Strain CCMP 2436" /LENGTH=181 /DNA_ID=CAMNT_0021809441 /DNA_START=364 /DNA_END=905 /DNA_ORIENTATION=-